MYSNQLKANSSKHDKQVRKYTTSVGQYIIRKYL